MAKFFPADEVSLLVRATRKLLGLVGLAGADHKMRENAANWLELADRVWHYRRDQLSEAERKQLAGRTDALRQARRERADAGKLKLLVEELEGTLRRVGGRAYPKTALVENVEFFLVAAIVILGVRTYFVQPFKIPTNSMWPSYYGMTPEAFRTKAEEPGALKRVARFLTLGAVSRRIDAPAEGEVLIPIELAQGSNRAYVASYREVPGRKWLIFPTTLKEYRLFVGDEPVTVTVPEDFDFEWAVRDVFFPSAGPTHEPAGVDLARIWMAQDARRPEHAGRVSVLRTGKRVKAGERVMAFDILTGDQLLVDRISYHFTRPQVGQGFVFRTGNIHSDFMTGRDGQQIDQYYIKRLAGVPGDVLAIKSFTLYRNGRPNAGAPAFGQNARRDGDYVGYRNIGLLADGQTATVPKNGFLALGDNSANSTDGRYWGFVPAKDVVGKPLFIYYPLTKRWGPAQ